MPCRHPGTRVTAGALAVCLICASILREADPVSHLPEPGTYRPLPGPAYSISSNFGGTAIATAVRRNIALDASDF